MRARLEPLKLRLGAADRGERKDFATRRRRRVGLRCLRDVEQVEIPLAVALSWITSASCGLPDDMANACIRTGAAFTLGRLFGAERHKRRRKTSR